MVGLLPDDRRALHERIAKRFDGMLAQGLVAEARTLARRVAHDEDLPAYRAVGYRQAWPHVRGEAGLDEFRAAALAATRQLAKRQLTWLRGWDALETLPWGPAERLARDIAERLDGRRL